jgi:hypothetical protein
MITETVAGSEYGYGIYTIDKGGYRRIGHGGDMPGYEAYMFADLDCGLGTVVLAAQPYPSGLWMRVHECWRAAGMGATLPDLPPPAEPARVDNAGDYAGIYRAGEKVLTVVHAQDRLALDVGGERIALERRGEDSFCANHPDWDLFLLAFGRAQAQGDEPGPVVELMHGADWYAGERYDGLRSFPYPPEWDAYAGHYRMHNPWLTNFRVLVRKGALWFVWPWGDEDPLTPLDDGSFRVGWDTYSPERLYFDQVAGGVALRATLSGCHYYRFFTP